MLVCPPVLRLKSIWQNILASWCETGLSNSTYPPCSYMTRNAWTLHDEECLNSVGSLWSFTNCCSSLMDATSPLARVFISLSGKWGSHGPHHPPFCPPPPPPPRLLSHVLLQILYSKGGFRWYSSKGLYLPGLWAFWWHTCYSLHSQALGWGTFPSLWAYRKIFLASRANWVNTFIPPLA